MSWLRRLIGASVTQERVAGPPTSSNGASSFHLFWDVGPEAIRAVEATVVIEDPVPYRLVFCALQVSPAGGFGRLGGLHFGLQHHPGHPAGGAINWGGYHARGGEVDGSALTVPSAMNNRNTGDYAWRHGRPYRYRIDRSDAGWRGSITDLDLGETMVVRDLHVDGDRLEAPMVWTESFAHCDDPAMTVRWSDLTIETDAGRRTIRSGRINHQTVADGGCSNTDWSVDGDAFVQRTSTERTRATGDRLSLRICPEAATEVDDGDAPRYPFADGQQLAIEVWTIVAKVYEAEVTPPRRTSVAKRLPGSESPSSP